MERRSSRKWMEEARRQVTGFSCSANGSWSIWIRGRQRYGMLEQCDVRSGAYEAQVRIGREVVDPRPPLASLRTPWSHFRCAGAAGASTRASPSTMVTSRDAPWLVHGAEDPFSLSCFNGTETRNSRKKQFIVVQNIISLERSYWIYVCFTTSVCIFECVISRTTYI